MKKFFLDDFKNILRNGIFSYQSQEIDKRKGISKKISVYEINRDDEFVDTYKIVCNENFEIIEDKIIIKNHWLELENFVVVDRNGNIISKEKLLDFLPVVFKFVNYWE